MNQDKLDVELDSWGRWLVTGGKGSAGLSVIARLMKNGGEEWQRESPNVVRAYIPFDNIEASKLDDIINAAVRSIDKQMYTTMVAYYTRQDPACLVAGRLRISTATLYARLRRAKKLIADHRDGKKHFQR